MWNKRVCLLRSPPTHTSHNIHTPLKAQRVKIHVAVFSPSMWNISASCEDLTQKRGKLWCFPSTMPLQNPQAMDLFFFFFLARKATGRSGDLIISCLTPCTRMWTEVGWVVVLTNFGWVLIRHTPKTSRKSCFFAVVTLTEGSPGSLTRLPGKSRGMADGERIHKTGIQQKKKPVSEAVLEPN